MAELCQINFIFFPLNLSHSLPVFSTTLPYHGPGGHPPKSICGPVLYTKLLWFPGFYTRKYVD